MTKNADLNTILQNLTDFLDIPESYFEQARQRYQAFGNWLERDASVVSQFEPEIFPQGSFSLGTVTKPISNEDDYDIDLVCKLELSKKEITQKKLKELVGLELENYAEAHNMQNRPEEKRRSWRLNYAEGAQFHLDVLPSIPDIFVQTGSEIAITDNQQANYHYICDDWMCCDPVGYAEWFKERMEVQFNIRRKELAEVLKANVDDVPVYKVKTPLQRVVQILKRHRDVTYESDPEDKPVSILITTLAAQAYENEGGLVEALVNVVTRMADHIEDRDGILWVANPVSPSENFADKWQEYPQRQDIFLQWLNLVEIDVLEAVNALDFQTTKKSLQRQFGEFAINEAMKLAYIPTAKITTLKESTTIPISFDVAHRQKPSWYMQLNSYSRVRINARVIKNGYRPKNYFNNGDKLPKNTSLHFIANTNVPKPYDVYWQVVNTGEEAQNVDALRGGFYETSQIKKGKKIRQESTLYKGTHWVECFIVKQGVCVARSGELVVNIV